MKINLAVTLGLLGLLVLANTTQAQTQIQGLIIGRSGPQMTCAKQISTILEA